MDLIFSLKPKIRFVLPEDSCLEVEYLESAELVICSSAFAGRETTRRRFLVIILREAARVPRITHILEVLLPSTDY